MPNNISPHPPPPPGGGFWPMAFGTQAEEREDHPVNEEHVCIMKLYLRRRNAGNMARNKSLNRRLGVMDVVLVGIIIMCHNVPRNGGSLIKFEWLQDRIRVLHLMVIYPSRVGIKNKDIFPTHRSSLSPPSPSSSSRFEFITDDKGPAHATRAHQWIRSD